MKELELTKQKMLNLGFSPREVKVYTVMFKKKDFTATEIQKLVDIPRTKIYEVLHKLIAKGFCAEKKIGRNKRYEVVNPKTSFSSLIEQLKEDITEKEKTAISATDILSSIYKQREENDNPLDYIEVIKDANQIKEKWYSLFKSAKYEVLGFIKSPYVSDTEKDQEKIREFQRDLIERGAKLKGIYEYSDALEKKFFERISRWAELGEEARVCNSLPIKLSVFDESVSMFKLDDPISSSPSLTTVFVHHKSFAAVFKHVFLSYWAIATPFEAFKAQQENKK